MSNSPQISSQSANEFSKRRNRRYQLYVWVITSTTIIVIALLAWPFSVKQFSSTAEVRLSFDPSALERENANATIAKSIADNTTDEQLTRLIEEVCASNKIKSLLLDASQVVALRNAIKVSTREGRSANDVDLKITILGAGTDDEIVFVNRLSNLVATDLATGPGNQVNREFLTNWRRQFTQQLEEQNDFMFQASGLLNEQLSLAIDQRNRVYQQLPDMSFTEESESDEIESINLQHQIAKAFQTMQQDQAQNNLPDNHPRMATHRQQLESLKTRLNNSYQNHSAQRVTNQFTNVATNTVRKTSMDQLLEQLKIEELDTSFVIVDKLQKQMQTNQVAQREMLDMMSKQLAGARPMSDVIRLDKLSLAVASRPVGGVPVGKQFFTIGLLAFVLGGVMAWQYKPEMRRRRFQSAEHASNVLGLQTIGVLRETTNKSEPGAVKRWLITNLFKICEYVLLALAVMLIIAMLANSDIFGTVMENPFQAFSKIIWMITPR